MGHYDNCREDYCAACGQTEDSHGYCIDKWCSRSKGGKARLKKEADRVAKENKKIQKSREKTAKTLTVSQYNTLIAQIRKIKKHRQIIDELYREVEAIVPEGENAGGLFDIVYNDFGTLDEALNILKIKVKAT